MQMILLLPILLPLVSGVLLGLLPRLDGGRRLRVYVGVSLLAGLAACVLVCPLAEGARLTLWDAGGALSFSLRADGLSRVFLPLAAAMWTVAGFYALCYMPHEGAQRRFFGFYLATLGMLSALFLSENLVTMYLCFEMTTLLSVPLVLHSMTKDAIRAGLKYLFYSVAGAFMALFGVFMLSSCAPGASFAPGGALDPALLAGREGAVLTGVFFAILGFGTKAGMFPMHGWLPTAHPIAPAPASAVLSGVITKAGVFCLIRTVYYTSGAVLLRGSWVQYAWIALALVTVFMGSMMAYREPVLKKRLAYSSVSQLSYVLLGLALLEGQAFTGAVQHVVFHSVVKDGLFLAAGAMILKTGATRVDELRGIGRTMPATLWCYTLLSLALVGIPPFCGFVSKWNLASGALASGTGALAWIAPAVLLLSALLTAGYLFPLSIRGFFPGADFPDAARSEAPIGLLLPVAILAAASLLLGLFPGAVTGAIEAVARLVM